MTTAVHMASGAIMALLTVAYDGRQGRDCGFLLPEAVL